MTRAASGLAKADEVLASAARRLPRALDPVDFLAAFPGQQRFLWIRDDAEESIAAVGAAASIECAGASRFAEAEDAVAALRETAPSIDGVLVGGFAFDGTARGAPHWRDFPAAQLVLPQLALVRRGRETRLIASVGGPRDAQRGAALALGRAWARLERLPTPRGDAPSRNEPPAFRVRALTPAAAWRRAVRRALADVEAGRLDKLVLARAVEVSAGSPIDPLHVATRLRAAHPGCAVFAVLQGRSAFLGATPERLARVDGDRLETAAVAGSAPRGESAAEDRARAAALRASVKDRAEHAVVVDDLVARLRPLCRTLTAPRAPRILRTPAVQHLWTPLRGRLHAGVGLLGVAGALHPTPAICGLPRQAARSRLLAREETARGWYGGCIGWLDAADPRSGELGVAIRAALIRGERALLHAGAGLVRGSRWEAELEETRLKLRVMLHALLEV